MRARIRTPLPKNSKIPGLRMLETERRMILKQVEKILSCSTPNTTKILKLYIQACFADIQQEQQTRHKETLVPPKVVKHKVAT
jgi:hypothetical protein